MIKTSLKFGAVCAAAAGMLTFLMTITSSWNWPLDPHGQVAASLFSMWLSLITPAEMIPKVVGIEEWTVLLGSSLPVVLNTLLCFPVGMIIGAIVHIVSRLLTGEARLRSVTLWAAVCVPIALTWLLVLCFLPVAVCATFGKDPIPLAACLPLLVATTLILQGLVRYRPHRGTDGEPGASPNGGPAERLGNSGVQGGPPSVS